MNILFQSSAFTITESAVYEGDFKAVALSPLQLQSDFDGQSRTRRLQPPPHLPVYQSPFVLTDALYNLALEEAALNIRADGAFMAGEKWPGVWTRDISYSIVLALAAIFPVAAKISLLAKVKNGVIVQDTGTGGSWPISTDRMAWALAAWEVFCVSDDHEWLRQAFAIICASAQADLAVARDYRTGLFYGESSFLDWREQTYPRWLDPKDIFGTQCLGTNAVHYQAYRILAQMARLLNEPDAGYDEIAEAIRHGINTYLWQTDCGYYGQYRYGRNHPILSNRAEALGEALCILYDIANPAQQARILTEMPVTAFGPTCIFPQTPDIPPYHNQAIWPFVVAFWSWAAAKAGQVAAVEHGLACLYRSAALFLTYKENMVASSGHFSGTAINSDRQLWSVAGGLASVYRVLFGLRFMPDALRFKPFVPTAYAGHHTLRNFRYRQANLTLHLHGSGSTVERVTLDGLAVARPILPGDLCGEHELDIYLSGALKASRICLTESLFAPETPAVKLIGERLCWSPVGNAVGYEVFCNGKRVAVISEAWYDLPKNSGGDRISDVLIEYQVRAVDGRGFVSFLSEPFQPEAATLVVEPIAALPDYVVLTKDTPIKFDFEIRQDGFYVLDFYYANGHGPLNTDNKAAIRTLWVDGARIGAVVMPQRGDEAWDGWGYTNLHKCYFSPGVHWAELRFGPENENMNGETNTARLDHLRIIQSG